MRRLIPLNAVRAFEAAARHTSLTAAAAELHVTSTAISHHVRALEDFLQVRLFRRKGSRIFLTHEGRLCLGALTDGLDRLEAALDLLSRDRQQQKLSVCTSPVFASRWLLPRLRRFTLEHPGLDLDLTVTMDQQRFGDDGIDVAIRYTRGSHPDRRTERLMEEELFPVCAPALLAAAPAGADDALARLPLIHDDTLEAVSLFPSWRRYLETTGITRVDAGGGGLRFNNHGLAIDAALDGWGVLIGRSRLVGALLAEGRLVRVGEAPAYPVHFHYYVVSRRKQTSAIAGRFREWLMAEAAGTAA